MLTRQQVLTLQRELKSSQLVIEGRAYPYRRIYYAIDEKRNTVYFLPKSRANDEFFKFAHKGKSNFRRFPNGKYFRIVPWGNLQFGIHLGGVYQTIVASSLHLRLRATEVSQNGQCIFYFVDKKEDENIIPDEVIAEFEKIQAERKKREEVVDTIADKEKFNSFLTSSGVKLSKARKERLFQQFKALVANEMEVNKAHG